MNVGKSEKAQASCRKKKLRPHQAALLTVFCGAGGHTLQKVRHTCHGQIINDINPYHGLMIIPEYIWAIYQAMAMAHMGFLQAHVH